MPKKALEPVRGFHAAELVELPHDQRVAGPEVVEGGGEAGPLRAARLNVLAAIATE
jgi:hypothetical protein